MDERPAIASREDSVLVIVDCQERIFPVMDQAEDLEHQLLILLRGARFLDVPVVITEQYPKGLGATLPSIREAAPGVEAVQKLSFSCFGEPAFVDCLHGLDRGTVVLAGIESHVCVAQTGLDLLAAGYKVQVLEDAVSSRAPLNRRSGLRRQERQGAVLSCVEAVLFDWMEGCRHPRFRDVQGLLK